MDTFDFDIDELVKNLDKQLDEQMTKFDDSFLCTPAKAITCNNHRLSFGSFVYYPTYNRRGYTHFWSVRKYKRDTKDNDLQVFKFEKVLCKPSTILEVANDIVKMLKELQIDVSKFYVTSAPAGLSAYLNKPHFATMIAIEVANLLHLEFIKVFKDRPRSTGSHPKVSMDKDPIELIVKIDRPCLLIDDVATTGMTICECIKLFNNKVIGLAWIYGSKK